jgi:hypothetical protein
MDNLKGAMRLRNAFRNTSPDPMAKFDKRWGEANTAIKLAQRVIVEYVAIPQSEESAHEPEQK